MSVANLTRYGMGVAKCGIGDDVDIIPVTNGEFVKFEEAVEASSNSLQRLKAEIVAMCAEFISSRHGILKSGPDFRFVEKMRQLSAI